MNPDEPYSPDEVPELDALYESVGLGTWWMGSEQRDMTLNQEETD